MRNSLVLIIVGIVSVFSAVSTAANPQVTLHITGAVTGDIVLELYADEAPITVENFINYVQTGFYDGLIFHRVSTNNRVIQSGSVDANLDPRPTGPTIINESSNRLSNVRGTVGMARTSEIDSATSGFYINFADNTYFDFGYVPIDYNYMPPRPWPAQIGYCVFGEVTSGMDVVDAIAAVETTNELPVNDVIIQSAVITHTVPVCAEKMPGDIDGDCDVDLADFAAMAENWAQCNSITGSCS